MMPRTWDLKYPRTVKRGIRYASDFRTLHHCQAIKTSKASNLARRGIYLQSNIRKPCKPWPHATTMRLAGSKRHCNTQNQACTRKDGCKGSEDPILYSRKTDLHRRILFCRWREALNCRQNATPPPHGIFFESMKRGVGKRGKGSRSTGHAHPEIAMKRFQRSPI